MIGPCFYFNGRETSSFTTIFDAPHVEWIKDAPEDSRNHHENYHDTGKNASADEQSREKVHELA